MGYVSKPAFIITIDTEGDNLWARRREVKTENAKFLPRFQEFCESFGLKVTYLTDYEMAVDPTYVKFAREALGRGFTEVGMHLHAWHSPPFEAVLSAEDHHNHPFLIEFSDDQMAAKISAMTELLNTTFEVPITSHRAGRWAFDARYAAMLAQHGYLADCSVTPFTSWSSHKGDPTRAGGTDYRFAPSEPYFMDPNDVLRPGRGPLLQIPMTVMPRRGATQRLCPGPLLANKWGQRVMDRVLPNQWLRPSSRRPGDMLEVTRRCLAEGRSYAMLMTHSSELMPGGSPYFPTEEAVEKNYERLGELFAFVAENFEAMTVTEFARDFIAAQEAAAA